MNKKCSDEKPCTKDREACNLCEIPQLVLSDEPTLIDNLCHDMMSPCTRDKDCCNICDVVIHSNEKHSRMFQPLAVSTGLHPQVGKYYDRTTRLPWITPEPPSDEQVDKWFSTYINRTYTDYLKDRLKAITEAEDKKDYATRNIAIHYAMIFADKLGYKTGIRIDPKEPLWPVAYIELPTGQVSWHLPQHEYPWDGHTTEEKYDRIKRYVEE